MKRTIELPEELVDLLDKYLKYHSSEELCRLLKSAMLIEPEFKDLSRFISLAGLVKEAPENQVLTQVATYKNFYVPDIHFW